MSLGAGCKETVPGANLNPTRLKRKMEWHFARSKDRGEGPSCGKITLYVIRTNDFKQKIKQHLWGSEHMECFRRRGVFFPL